MFWYDELSGIGEYFAGFVVGDFQREDDGFEFIVYNGTGEGEGLACEPGGQLSFVYFEAFALPVLVEPVVLYLTSVGQVPAGSDEVGEEGHQSRTQAGLGQQRQFQLLHTNHLVAIGLFVQAQIVMRLPLRSEQLHADLHVFSRTRFQILLYHHRLKNCLRVFLIRVCRLLIAKQDNGLCLFGLTPLQILLVETVSLQVEHLLIMKLIGYDVLEISLGSLILKDQTVAVLIAMVSVKVLVQKVSRSYVANATRYYYK